MNERQQKRLERLRQLIARGKYSDADALLARDLTLTPEQKQQVRGEIDSASGEAAEPSISSLPKRTPSSPQLGPKSPFTEPPKSSLPAAAAAVYGRTSGARQLPQAHLSARVPWHDTDWTGRVCADPSANHWCTVLKNVKDEKDPEREAEDAGAQWASLSAKRVPPCVVERGGFMRPDTFEYPRRHAYAGGWTQSHAHFTETVQRMPPFSVEATPYRWTMREQAPTIADKWGITFEPEAEDRADTIIETSKPTTWVQDHRNQAAMLDSFFSAVVPHRSLLFLYAKDVPLQEDSSPGSRVLVGVGRVCGVGEMVEWNYSRPGPLRSVMWERAVEHSIRPDFADGFLLPYHALLASTSLRGTDLSRFVAVAPGEHFEEFSYVSELVDHDAAIAALLELARVVDLLPGVVDGPWQAISSWLSDRLGEVWGQRGPYPGLGAVLSAIGIERGAFFAYKADETLADGDVDPWPALDTVLKDAGRSARKVWVRLQADSDRLAIVRLLARFPLTVEQSRRLLDSATSDVLENPYLLFENDRGREDSVSFATIDRGMFPQSAAAVAALGQYPLPEPIEESGDDRRVRAACVQILEDAAAQGHTLLDEPTLRRRLAALPLQPACDPANALFDVAVDEFPPALREHPTESGGRAWQLDRLSTVSDLILQTVQTSIDAGPLAVDWNWRAAVDGVFMEKDTIDDAEEDAARTEKAAALAVLARSRFSALIGPAGTGKTTLLNALCTHPDVASRGVLLLAPTGKARVQLGDRAGVEALTLAQFLRPSGRWNHISGYQVLPGKPKNGGHATVIVDEASMLTEEMLAALLDGVVGAQRIILCGDHRQLPPIGAGRPFADIIAHFRGRSKELASGGGIAELTVSRRQRAAGPDGRDDILVASLFSVDGSAPAADEALARVLARRGDGTMSVHTWSDEKSLRELVETVLENDPELQLTKGDRYGLMRSLGATGEYEGRPAFVRGKGGLGAENWQLLSPVRARDGGVNTLNDVIRQRYRPIDLYAARRGKGVPPLGSDQILRHDKVMCVRNHNRRMWRPSDREVLKQPVANGEIGMTTEVASTKGLKVEFASRPDAQFTFWTSELNGDSDGDLLDLAYAVTVHKSQGSQFGVTFVVIPQPCALLSPELLYTALTRQQERTVLLLQGSTNDLWTLAGPERSETARRLTRLFHAPDPFATADGTYLDGGRVHRTAAGELVRSKSEVIVANTLRHIGIEYKYEQPLVMADATRRLPDFTAYPPGRSPVYWEHLGMLTSPGYRADWKAKRNWYATHDILPFDDGGGPAGSLVWSDEDVSGKGIASDAIESLARRVFGVE